MPTVAEQLREGREKANLDVYQVAEVTKIKTDHVRALEDGNYNAFSAPVYIRGFVRTYAKLLKLNVPAVLVDLDEELSQTKKFREPPPLVNEAGGALDFLMLQLSKLNWRIIAVVGGIAALLIFSVVSYRAYHRRAREDPLKDLGPGLYEPAQSSNGNTLPLPDTGR